MWGGAFARWGMRFLIACSVACGGEAADPGSVSTSAGPGSRDASVAPGGSGRSAFVPPATPAPADAPTVFLIVDTSGSMERAPGCACETPTCEECLPDCEGGEPSRFIELLSALTGSFDAPGCTVLPRTRANGASFDVGYYLPHHRPHFEGGRGSGGAIDVYGDRLRFGFGSFDGFDTYVGAPPLVPADDFDTSLSAGVAGLWSFGSFVDDTPRVRPDGSVAGRFAYPGAMSYFAMDTGLRSTAAGQGALIFPRASDPDRNDDVRRAVDSARPYGTTPIAAALDDLDFYLRGLEAAERGEVHVVLLTDGYPDDDYRAFGCDCDEATADADTCAGAPPAAVPLACPYPLADEAARALRCGHDSACDDGVVEAVHVVAFEVSDPQVREALDEIATAGGTDSAELADAGQLANTLDGVLQGIVE